MITNKAQITQALQDISLLIDQSSLFQESTQHNTLLLELLPRHQLLLETVDALIQEQIGEEPLFQPLSDGLVDNIRYTYDLLSGYLAQENWSLLESKTKFQLFPLLKALYACLYFLSFVKGDPQKETDFFQKEQHKLFANPDQDRYLDTGEYPYTVSIMVLAYNQLEYTKQCVDAILKQTPTSLNYELILVNHGSSDGTRDFFNSFPQAKHLDLKNNDLTFSITCLPFLYQGKYTCYISNDVVVGANYLENMITCMESDPKVHYIVPTTPNIAGGQTIDHPNYGDDMEKMTSFSKKNNHSDPKRWEQRVRLCNPICLFRSQDIASSENFLSPPIAFAFSGIGFGDDYIAHKVRRHGGKVILAKDAFCHHFGNVTLKHENNYLTTQHIQNKRDYFKQCTGLDPYERGCHSYQALLHSIEKHHQGALSILAINSRLSHTALELKELLRQQKNVTSCHLHLVTEEPFFLEELQSIGDSVTLYQGVDSLSALIGDTKYQYILLEEPLTNPTQESAVVSLLQDSLGQKGSLFVKTPQPDTLKIGKHWEALSVFQEPEREFLPWYQYKSRGKS